MSLWYDTDGNVADNNVWTGTQQFNGSVGFYATAPVTQTAAYTLTYATKARVLAADTAANVVTTAAALASYGYAQAQADSIPVAINAIRVDLDTTKNVLAQVVADLQRNGMMA